MYGITNIYEDINKKYESLDNEIENELKRIDEELRKLKKSYNLSAKSERINELNVVNNSKLTFEEIKLRNKEIIKEISISKSRLRSRAIYYPAEVTWCSIMHNYKNEPSLQGIEWQCCNDMKM